MKKGKLFLLLIILAGFFLRTFNINWDNGYVFHPDERAIIMFTIPLEIPKSFSEFISPQSSLNPNFFAYGNFPVYLLKIASDTSSIINPLFSQYGGMHIVGRLINAFFDTSTILVLFLLTRRLFNAKTGLIAAFFYSISVFPIQNSHFFTVDIPLTFFTLLSLYFLDLYIEKPSLKHAVFTGIAFGLSIATKISILPLIFVIAFGFLIARLKIKRQFSLSLFLTRGFYSLSFFFTAVFIFFITQPYTFIDFNNFFSQISLQSKMSSDPYLFPYTLQYVGKIPIIHELTNIALWGLGIPLSIFAFIGTIFLTAFTIKHYRKSYRIIPLVFFFWLYFLLVSNYAVGFMRYLLPIYPLFALFSAVFCVNLLFPIIIKAFHLDAKPVIKKILLIIFVLISSIWTLSFLSIYTRPNTRISASDWIHENILPGKTLAVEHWDDGLPVYDAHKYKILSFPLYDPDTEFKRQGIDQQLKTADYIIIASNRLYIPLQKLTNCKVLPENRCYPRTAEYYKKLFSEKLGFKKVAEFYSYPTIPFTNIIINDQSADESFTVYDHPKVMIFQRK